MCAPLLKVMEKLKKIPLIVMSLLVLGYVGFDVYTEIKNGNAVSHVINGAVLVLLAVLLVLIVADELAGGDWPSVRQVMFLLFIASIDTVFFGQWLAHSVRETSYFNQDVSIKGETMSDVKVVIVMSRHTVLLKDDVLYVVPTADISKFRGVDKKAKPKFIPEE